MAASVVRAPGDITPFREAFARIRTEFEVPAAFPAPVNAEAASVVAAAGRSRPMAPRRDRRAVDARDVPFVTIDPPGSLDLDQAFHAERNAGGFRVRYAIADVAAFVAPGERARSRVVRAGRDALPPRRARADAARPARRRRREPAARTGTRGVGVDDRSRRDRRATTAARLERARCAAGRSSTIPGVQAALDAGRADEPLQLLREIGTRRLALEAARGRHQPRPPFAGSHAVGGRRFRARVRGAAGRSRVGTRRSPCSRAWRPPRSWSAARVGILRTVPAPEQFQVDRLRRSRAGSASRGRTARTGPTSCGISIGPIPTVPRS